MSQSCLSTSIVRTAALVLSSLLAAPAVHAQGVGFIGGGSVDPEQFYAGTFFELPPISRNTFVRPGVDGGWGSDLRLGSINIDIVFRSDTASAWQFYTGGGPAILIARADEDAVDRTIENDVTGGLAGLIGFSHSNGFLTEFRFTRARNGPSLKFGVGFKVGGSP